MGGRPWNFGEVIHCLDNHIPETVLLSSPGHFSRHALKNNIK